jgi:carbohydrate-binding DOMON domain-containing protein
MNRMYLGSKGDYGAMNMYALGYVDNVRLTASAAVTVTPTEQVTTVTTITTKNPTLKQTSSIPTPYPTDTPKSSAPGTLAIAALGIIGVWGVLGGIKKN